MSEHPVEQEPDRSPLGRIGLVILVVMIIFGLGIAWSVWLAGKPKPFTISKSTAVRVDRTLIRRASAGRDRKAAQVRRLESYGPVPGNPDVVRIPIARAMQLYLARLR